MGRKTDFIVMGMPKCGTTSCFMVLNQHSKIEFPKSGKHALYYKKYRSVEAFEKKYWKNSKKNIKHGFCAENWKENINVREMAQDFSNDLKIIFLLRNPVERAYSEYKYSHSMCYPNFDVQDSYEFYKLSHAVAFDRFVKKYLYKSKRIFDNGNYYKIIYPYIKYFGRDRVKIIIFEELVQDSEKVYNELFEFLGLKKEKVDFNIKANEGRLLPTNLFYYFLYRLLFMRSINICMIWLRDILFSTEITSMCNSIINFFYNLWFCEDKDKTNILPETYEKLKKYYRKDCKQLSELLCVGEEYLGKIWFENN